MANPEHLNILKQGVKAWNQWRSAASDVRPDLKGAKLVGADLRNADLSVADLRGAELHGADLIEAIFVESVLCVADLSEAKLAGANLVVADLRAANLSGADLSSTYLFVANLSGSNLVRANLTGARVHGSAFADVDLSQTAGLETVAHFGPSTIGVDTLYKSKGRIPESFLRGCGVPEEFIRHLTSLFGQPTQFYSCFISYSHEDKAFARLLHDRLQAQGIRCWLDEHQMLPGDDMHEGIDRGIRLWDKVLLCASKSSLTDSTQPGWLPVQRRIPERQEGGDQEPRRCQLRRLGKRSGAV